MIKIEMQKMQDDKGNIKSQEFLWLMGQAWPINEADDSRIVRLEAFGGELQECLTHSAATGKPIADSNGIEVCRTWYQADAQAVSKQMRRTHP